LPDKRMKSGLSRFISFCEANAIIPRTVSDAVSARFLAHLECDTLVPKPRDCHRRTCRLWNVAAETEPGWPALRLSVPDYRKPRRTLPISSFPLSFQEELARYLDHLRRGDVFSEEAAEKPLAPITVRHRATQLGLAVSALAISGRDPDSITSLAYLVYPDAFKAILRHYFKDGEPTAFARDLAQSLVTLARRWVGLDLAALDRIRELQRRLGNNPRRLTEKNRTLLRTLDEPAVRERLFALPERLAKKADRDPPARGAIAMQLATAIVILQNAPLRMANLVGLRLDRHLVRPGGPRSLWQIDIPPHEVKNGEALVYELPHRATAQVDCYIRRFRRRSPHATTPICFRSVQDASSRPGCRSRFGERLRTGSGFT
jgi:hypothetical protein